MAKNLALFVDCDRLEVAFMTVIFDYLRSKDYNICIKQAYVTKDNLDSWYNQLEKNYFKILLGGNQANINMRLSVDVSKSLYCGKYDSVAIASNYREFGVLASEIRSRGLEAICFYQYSKGSESFLKRSYNTIYNLEPNKVKEQSNDFLSTGDMLDEFASALEVLDTQTLTERLSDNFIESKPKASTKRKTRAKSSTTKSK